MKKRWLAFGLVFLLLGNTQQIFASPAPLPLTPEEKAYIALQETVYVGGALDFYPFEYYDKSEKCFKGILPDFLQEVTSRSGIQFEYQNGASEENRFYLGENLQTEMVSCFTDDAELTSAAAVSYCLSAEVDGSVRRVGFAFTQLAPPELISAVEKSLASMSAADRDLIVTRYASRGNDGAFQWWLLLVGGALLVVLAATAAALWHFLKEKKKETEYYKFFDEVTGLWNLRCLQHNYVSLLTDKSRTLYSVIYIGASVNHIREVYSDAEADGVLKYISDILMESLSEQEIAARVDANYFAVLKRSGEPEEIVSWLQGVFESIQVYPYRNAKDYSLDPRAGVYRLGHMDKRIDAPLANARMACDESVRRELSCVICTPQLLRSFSDEGDLRKDLRRGLKNKEFTIFFQPYLDVCTGKIVGCEALARWEHPLKGLQQPGQFIQLLERGGMITEMDFYIFEMACGWIANRKNHGLQVIPVSCNFSKVNFKTDEFYQRITRIMELYGILPAHIRIEIKESIIGLRSEMEKRNLQKLFQKGLVIYLDNFGTGGVPFQVLKEYGLSAMKIDRDVLKGAADKKGRAVLQSLIHMIHQLDAKALCEGAETGEQVKLLRELSCDMVQGYYYYQPMPITEMDQLLFREFAKNN